MFPGASAQTTWSSCLRLQTTHCRWTFQTVFEMFLGQDTEGRPHVPALKRQAVWFPMAQKPQDDMDLGPDRGNRLMSTDRAQ